MRAVPPLPRRIADLVVPQDEISVATWHWAHRTLPDYLLTHSVRAYCWGAALAAGEGWAFDRRILWTASLMHDVGLTRIAASARCFEVDGAEVARRFLEGQGMEPDAADRVATAIVLHMQPNVTLADGVESLLLDRATALDVRGVGYRLVGSVRSRVVERFPRRDFDRHFGRALSREAALRPGCQSARLLAAGLIAGMAGSPWTAGDG